MGCSGGYGRDRIGYLEVGWCSQITDQIGEYSLIHQGLIRDNIVSTVTKSSEVSNSSLNSNASRQFKKTEIEARETNLNIRNTRLVQLLLNHAFLLSLQVFF